MDKELLEKKQKASIGKTEAKRAQMKITSRIDGSFSRKFSNIFSRNHGRVNELKELFMHYLLVASLNKRDKELSLYDC